MSELTDKLLAIAFGDIDLVQEAIRAAAAENPAAKASLDTADLEKVVAYILANRDRLREKVA